MLSLVRTLKLGVATAVACAATAPSAFAACPTQSFSTVFSAWGDMSLYTLAPNGDFEAGDDGWTLTGNAQIVGANAHKLAIDHDGTKALQLANGATATSPPICVGAGYPTTRMVANTVGRTPLSGSTLQMEILYTDPARGGQAVKKLGTVPDQYTWNATRKMSIAQGQLNIKPDSSGNTYIRVRLTPLYDTTWRIDDLYVDPRFRA